MSYEGMQAYYLHYKSPVSALVQSPVQTVAKSYERIRGTAMKEQEKILK